MFEEIFFPRTAERYRTAPVVDQRERYLVHLRETGAKRPTLRKCANDQLSLVRLLKLKEGGTPASSNSFGADARRRRPWLCDRFVCSAAAFASLQVGHRDSEFRSLPSVDTIEPLSGSDF
jgi:hypothetical protein